MILKRIKSAATVALIIFFFALYAGLWYLLLTWHGLAGAG